MDVVTLQAEIRVLFRYRDLVAATLDEHKKIIKGDGNDKGCWWGWWKRPTENGREEVWDLLQGEIQQRRYAYVGLFNSGTKDTTNAVVIAKVVEIIRPHRASDVADYVAPSLPTKQVELVPSYYRVSPFSRAWMRISEISDAPISFFGQFSFFVPPELPGIPPYYLERLRDKIIKDSEELRAMDTTIWQVRPKRDGDHDEKFLAPGTRISKAISADAITVKGSTILHLSDLHFATGQHRKQHAWGYPSEDKGSTLAEEVGRAVKGKGVSVIVVSGDFTFLAAEDEFTKAYESLNQLLGSLGLGSESLVIVPGNHDIAWGKSRGLKYKDGDPVDAASTEATKNYRQFYRKLLQHDATASLSIGRRFLFPHGGLVEICGLNSSNLESGKNFLAGMGRVDPSEFDKICDSMGWNNKGHQALRLLVMHHHLTATEDVVPAKDYSRGFGMACDARKILRESAKRGVHLALHGHQHRVFLWRESVFENPEDTQQVWELGDVAILGGGSAGSSEVDDHKHYFNLIRVESTSIEVEIYRAKKRAQFESMQGWLADVTMVGGRPNLGSWRVKTNQIV